MYSVVVAPSVRDQLINYAVTFTQTYGEFCTKKFIASYENAVASLNNLPQRGTKNLKYLPIDFQTIPFWKHLWFVYQVDEDNLTVHIDYMIDDRSDYGQLIV